ncbi:polymorphic toxin type 44 domain-containing protein [Phyllobacterium leguminum]|uniref:Putative RNase toxin 44 of polymorphic toxin system n=1 Tax=Phyllobacterium leguminum TaxID=314237 RepID=A0A318SRF2_9HYPH|nr:polymorphic toxin type 44 domain-containing protein [Phyllobacterium leguminum]PYE84182.1 putative RNase toxin 44 of polymorphic toxin system [Phyllobacterium leguminum]
MKQYWLTIKLKPHATHPVTHSSPMRLKAYFDESPPSGERPPLRAPAEKGSLQPLLPSGSQVFHFLLTAEEYNSGNFELYVWVEPYGAAALRLPGVMDDKATGRLKLTAKNTRKGGLPLPPPNSKPVDEQIIVETVELTNSVAQWTADQMNANAASAEAQAMSKLAAQEKRMAALEEQARAAASSGGFLERLGAQQISQSAVANAGNASLARNFIMGRKGHPDDTPAQYGGWGKIIEKREFWKGAQLVKSGVLNTVLGGGGEWDLKPLINSTWGDSIRFGNREYYITNDHFSNLHYGYVAGASGFTSAEANALANFLEDDTPLDRHVTTKGVNLYHRKKFVSWNDVVSLLDTDSRLHTEK